MKLNETQVKSLYRFTRQHFVEHYDIQSELVDHLANGIENQWTENPNISFDDALSNEFKKFGIYGFSEIVEKQQSVLTRKYLRTILGFIKEWFKFPKLCFTVFIFFTCYQFIMKFPGIIEVMLIVITALGLGMFIFNLYTYKKKQKAEKKRWLFKEIIFNTGGLISFSFLPLQLFHFVINKEIVAAPYNLSHIFLAFIFTFFLLSVYVVFFVIPKKSEQLLEDTYPEYKYDKIV